VISESQQVVSNIKTNRTYTNTANYWAPLIDENDDDGDDEEETINNINDATVQQDLKTTLRKWIDQCTNTYKPFKRREATMVVDSGATSSFVRPEENLPITGPSSKVVYLPDGSSIQATHTTMLPFDLLSPKARIADVLPGLRPNSLVSVGKLADANYTTIFHPQGIGVTVHNDTLRMNLLSKPVLQGWRDANGLWRLSNDEKNATHTTKSTMEVAANVYTLPSIKQAIRYLHAAAGFPTRDTWVKAITNGNFVTWPGLTVDIVKRHYPESVETQKGHLKKQRQNVRSTKKKISEDVPLEDCELTRTITKHNILVKVINANETVYTDQTGRLPIQSSKGNTSLMIYYDVDANYIDAEPLRNHADNQMISAYRNLWERTNRGRVTKPKLHILDNEASEAFKSAIKENCDLQLVPPDTHRRNLAERAIQTFKSHFISILAGVDPSFPMNLWDRLIPQAVMTLNLLRNSHKMPTISAYQRVNGNFDYNKLPLAPLGCSVEMHESTNRRRTWDPRSLTGWYLGTSTEHYRCHKVFCKKTRSERISDTVIFRHSYLTQPIISSDDQIVKAIGDLSSALRQQINARGKEEMEVLVKMNDILSNTPKEKAEIKKKVTFKDPIPSPKIGTSVSKLKQTHRPASSPRVIAKAIVDKPLPGIVSGPTTRSKYAQALADIVSNSERLYGKTVKGPLAFIRNEDLQRTRSSHRYPTRVALTITELAEAVLDDDPKAAFEFANEVFDADSGQMLKY
jgi:hypothetical protein